LGNRRSSVKPTLLLAIAILAGGCASDAGTSSTPAGPGPTSAVTSSPIAATSARPLPSGGISEAEAVAIATKLAPDGAVFESVQAEPFASVDPRDTEGLLTPPDHEVWVVKFAATAAPCAPGTSKLVCESPRPGTVTVVLDYVTGHLYVTAGDYPNPNR
jgi:hypothetical protein